MAASDVPHTHGQSSCCAMQALHPCLCAALDCCLRFLAPVHAAAVGGLVWMASGVGGFGCLSCTDAGVEGMTNGQACLQLSPRAASRGSKTIVRGLGAGVNSWDGGIMLQEWCVLLYLCRCYANGLFEASCVFEALCVCERRVRVGRCCMDNEGLRCAGAE